MYTAVVTIQKTIKGGLTAERGAGDLDLLVDRFAEQEQSYFPIEENCQIERSEFVDWLLCILHSENGNARNFIR